MKKLLPRLALAGAALLALGVAIVVSGAVSIRADSGHWKITEWFLRFAMKRSVATHSLGTEVPENLGSDDLVRLGAAHYHLACRSCHGEPGAPRRRQAVHMLPIPPELGGRVHESNPRKLFEVVKHGMKFTGMPAWPGHARDDEVWAVVAFLLKYPGMSRETYRQLAGHDNANAFPVASDGAGQAAPPPQVAKSCIACHGTDGLAHGNRLLPHLAGQRTEYLVGALYAYAADRRQSGIMEPLANALDDATIRRIAGYYAAMPARSHAAANASFDREAATRGSTIARNGIPAERVPACLECHSPSGNRTKPEYPLLAGQPAGYLESQLLLFRENRRGGGSHEHVMRAIATRLTPEQARDAAHYFASLEPADPRTAAVPLPPSP